MMIKIMKVIQVEVSINNVFDKDICEINKGFNITLNIIRFNGKLNNEVMNIR